MTTSTPISEQLTVQSALVSTHSIYSLLDRKTNVLGNPFISENELSAKRTIIDLLTLGGENLISTHPSDFDLVLLGSFNNRTGIVDINPVCLVDNCENLLEVYRSSLKNKRLISFDNSEETINEDTK